MPVAVKDNIVTTGMPTTCASRILGSFVSPVRCDGRGSVAPVRLQHRRQNQSRRVRDGSSTEHSAFGTARNPWDTTRCRWMSGGSAVAVAARMVPAALGSRPVGPCVSLLRSAAVGG